MPKPPKRKCHFSEEYTKEWSFIKRGRINEEVLCSICNIYISVSHGGKSDVQHHIRTKNHQSKLTSASTSKPISQFMIQENTHEEFLIAAAEITTAYQIAKHHQSFKSLDCTTKLSALIYSDSKIAAKQSTARTKATAIVKNILAVYSVSECIKDLQQISFFGIATDASNHKAQKMFPLIIQYFTETEGIQSKLLKLESLSNETSETVSKYCIDTLTNLEIPLEKLIAFCGDNTNTNFGGVNRRGQMNIFYKIKTEIRRNLEGIGCPAHILHNTISTAAGVLSVDIEVIVLKIFNYFSIYTVRTEKLKEFCEYVNVSYNTLLSHSRTRWLSLMSAVERILKIWVPLKNFFDAEDKPPKLISNFFTSSINEIYFMFVHSNLFSFEQNIKKMEKTKISIIEIRKLLVDLQNSLIERKAENFMGIQTKIQLMKLKKELTSDLHAVTKFEEEVMEFYATAIEYLQRWSASFKKFEVFDWMMLSKIPEWKELEETILYLDENGIEISGDNCFQQYIYLKNFLEKNIELQEWKDKSAEERWLYFLKNTEHTDQKSQLKKICEYLFAIPAHNAIVERIFSLMSAQWTDERNRLSADTVEALLQCQHNFKMTCSEFYHHIKDKKEILQKVKLSEKYNFKLNTS